VIQFDSAGNLWLGYEYLPSFASATAVEFTAAQIADIQANGSPAPMLSVQLGSDIEYINALVFDTQGNLWIAASTWAIDPNLMFGGVVEMFNVAGKSGTLSQPDVTITPSAISAINQSLDDPSSLAFDNQGSLWVSNPISSDLISGAQNSGGFIVKFSADQLTASGSPIPQTIITPNRKGSNFRFPALLLFGPTIK
jgi:secreted PhoX family phosphatase